VNLHFSVPRVAQGFFLTVAFVTLAYAGGTVAYAELYQKYESWKFASKIDTKHLIDRASIVAEPVDLSEGGLIGKLEIPGIGISVMVLQGVEEDTLRLGAGHVPGTPLPDREGNSVIAGHRDTFFRKLEGIQAGDRVQFSTVRGISEYVVESTEIVEPDETRVYRIAWHCGTHAHQLLSILFCPCGPSSIHRARPSRTLKLTVTSAV
jgi:LPXTG-site transpeptidase (sortase) family protein